MTAASKAALNKLKRDEKSDTGKGYQSSFLMSYCVYMLKSLGKKTVTYVGYTKNLKERVHKHNLGKGAKFTRGRKWILIYKEKFKSKKEAISREYYIKNNKLVRNNLKKKYL